MRLSALLLAVAVAVAVAVTAAGCVANQTRVLRRQSTASIRSRTFELWPHAKPPPALPFLSNVELLVEGEREIPFASAWGETAQAAAEGAARSADLKMDPGGRVLATANGATILAFARVGEPLVFCRHIAFAPGLSTVGSAPELSLLLASGLDGHSTDEWSAALSWLTSDAEGSEPALLQYLGGIAAGRSTAPRYLPLRRLTDASRHPLARSIADRLLQSPDPDARAIGRDLLSAAR